jgi:hypothetical protein
MKTLSRVYDSYAQARSAVADLEAAGVPPPEISLVANKYASKEYADVDDVSAAGKGAGVGAAVGGTAGLLAGLGLLAIPGLGPVVAAGWFAATALGAAAGAAAGAATGGIVAALVDAGESKESAHVYSEAVRRGGTLVAVRVADEEASRIQAILDRYQPIDPVVRGAEYQREGWKTFDPAAPPYKPSDAEIERIRRSNI